MHKGRLQFNMYMKSKIKIRRQFLIVDLWRLSFIVLHIFTSLKTQNTLIFLLYHFKLT
jgi:hypothetical protein